MKTPEDLFQVWGRATTSPRLILIKDIGRFLWPKKTAFVTPDGNYEFIRMPFGMKNSRATLVQGLRMLISDPENVDSYIDDLIVYTEDWDTHIRVLDELMNRLQQANLTARPTKCVFRAKSVEFLGHQVGFDWITVNDDNLAKIRMAQRPTTKKEVRSFLGLVNYYRAHIPLFAAISAPLSDLTRKGQPNKVQWGEAQERAFLTLQERLLKKPILKLPDHQKPFILRTDASNCGLGTSLMQEYDDKLYPVAYASKKLSSAECKYSTLHHECLAIVWGMTKFRLYLAGKPFILQTDHKPLSYLNQAKFQNDQIMRWALALQEYDYMVESIPGKDNVVADYLNRIIG